MRRIRVRAIIEYEGKFLFVRGKQRQYWALPGGHLEEGEALQGGLKRELIEELGVEPKIGKLVYVLQLFNKKRDDESLEFFFLVENGFQYTQVDLAKTSHGSLELEAVGFINPAEEHIQPEFLASLASDSAADLPKIFVRYA